MTLFEKLPAGLVIGELIYEVYKCLYLFHFLVAFS